MVPEILAVTDSACSVTFAMTSFPSGHTAQSFMAGTFLALYLNAKLKPFGDFHTSFWKMMFVLAPIIGAMFVAGSLVADRVRSHHSSYLGEFYAASC